MKHLRRNLLALTLGCLLPLPAGAFAPRPAGSGARKLVAILPASVVYGSQANGPVVSEALRDRMGRLGFDVIQATRVENVLKAKGYGEGTFLSAKDLFELKSELGVDYVAYPRVMSAGKSLGREEYAATILLNIGGSSKSGFAHTRQVSQTFDPRVKSEKPVMERPAADSAAERLLQGFENRAR